MAKKKKEKFQGVAYNYKPVERKMDLISDSDYIEERLKNQIDWHKAKCILNQKKYHLLKNVDTFIAALVPATLILHTSLEGIYGEAYTDGWEVLVKLLSALAGVWLTISAGFFELEGYEHKAKEYKKLYKGLESEMFKYQTRTEPYDEGDAFPRLVLNVENQLHLDVINYFKASPPEDKLDGQKEDEAEKPEED